MTEDDKIDFGKSKIDSLFNSIFYPTLLSMVFASLFTVADGIFVGQGVATLLMVIVAIAVYLFRIPFLRLLGCSDALLPLCQDYLLPILPGCICIVIQIIATVCKEPSGLASVSLPSVAY